MSGEDRSRQDIRAEIAALVEELVPEDQRHIRHCPICGFEGPFAPFVGAGGVRLEAVCPGCGSLERHRFARLCLDRDPAFSRLGRVLHVAPEPSLRPILEARAGTYIGSDLDPRRGEAMDLQATGLPDESIDTVVCHHVLEHVEDDALALKEIARILAPGGRAMLSVPLVWTWEASHEDPSVTGPATRHLHFGQRNHLRRYGRDFFDRLAAAGLDSRSLPTTPEDCVRHALPPSLTLHVATKA